MIKRIPSIFGIIAAMLVIIIGLVIGKSANEIIMKLVYIIAVSYCAGLILRFYLTKKVFPDESKNKNITDLTNDSEYNDLGAEVKNADGVDHNSIDSEE